MLPCWRKLRWKVLDFAVCWSSLNYNIYEWGILTQWKYTHSIVPFKENHQNSQENTTALQTYFTQKNTSFFDLGWPAVELF